MRKNDHLNPKDMEPLYLQLANRLKGRIDSGVYETGNCIPNETELCSEFAVSRITVRKAVQQLVDQGILEKHQGKGTYVKTSADTVDFREISSFHDACRKMGKKPSTVLIRAGICSADRQDQTALRLQNNRQVVETIRVLKADNIPITVEINHFPTVYSYLIECDLSGSLYLLLREFGIEPTQAIHDISIRCAEGEIAKLLHVAEGAPLLYLEEVIYDQKGRPLHTSKQWIRGDRYTFRI